jgi:hypothetical protein
MSITNNAPSVKDIAKSYADNITNLINGEAVLVDGEIVDASEVDDDTDAEVVEGIEAFCEYYDIYNVRYVVGGDLEFIGAAYMIACGGPNVWIDTLESRVEVYWGFEQGTADLPRDINAEIEEMAEMEYNAKA